MPEIKSQTNKKRGVFLIGGFDPKSADAFFARNRREANRFEELWGISVSDAEPEKLSKDVTLTPYISQPKDAQAPWRVKTDFHFLTLDDIVLEDFSKPLLTRLKRYVISFSDYVFSGTAFAFFRHAWRFAMYFCYPAGMLLIGLFVSLAIAMLTAASGLPFAGLFGILMGFAVLWFWVTYLGNRYFVLHLMDLWSFSRDFVHQSQSNIADKLDRFADLIAAQSAKNKYDEVLLIGHSTGGALILDTAGRAIERNTHAFDDCGSVKVLTVGSTELKIGLHPAAQAFRDRVDNLFEVSNFHWVEYQCMTDIINLYRTNPAKLMKLKVKPNIGKIKIRHMLEAETYQRIKRNFFRVHYQFLFGNTKRYHYDFFAICFAPADLIERVTNPAEFNDSVAGPAFEKPNL